MIINDSDGAALAVTGDNRAKVLAATAGYMHVMAEEGKAWVVTGSATAADTTDNVVFFFQNDSGNDFDCHGFIFSSSGAGLVTLEYGRTYTSGGGTALSLAQLNTVSGQTQDQTSYIANDIVLAGTGTDLFCHRVAADTPVDIISRTQALQLAPTNTIALRFQADTGTPVFCINYISHGQEPWEE